MGNEDLQVRGLVRMPTGADRLLCHPRLPLLAALDVGRPAVSVWDWASGEAREVATIGGDAARYDEFPSWERAQRTPSVSWHPYDPVLVVAGAEGGLRQWSLFGGGTLHGLPADGPYRFVAFDPQGRTVWASPASDLGDRDGNWNRSDAVDTASGTLGSGPAWDTGITAHPGGGLVLTWSSDQGATLGLFARVDDDGVPARMRVLRRALILDVDGYEAPVFSPDGRHFAVRGNAYGNTLQVFGFPSLREVLALTLGDPSPGYPPPPEWTERMQSWSRHNIAFAAPSGTLLVGTPTGTVVEVDVDTRQAVEHPVLAGSRVTALAAAATGDIVVAGSEHELVFLGRAGGGGPAQESGTVHARERVRAFLDATSELPDDADVHTDLELNDGTTTWTSEDLAATTTAAPGDPTWLQLQAFLNAARKQ